MYKFEKASVNIWDDIFMQKNRLSEHARLLYCYLLTCSLSNITGVYKISNERIGFDLGFSIEEVKDALRALRKARKAFRAGSYVIIVDAPLYLKKKLKTVLRRFTEIIEELPLKVKVKLYIYHYHWGDLENNKYTKDFVEKMKELGKSYKKPIKDLEKIKKLCEWAKSQKVEYAKEKDTSNASRQTYLIEYNGEYNGIVEEDIFNAPKLPIVSIENESIQDDAAPLTNIAQACYWQFSYKNTPLLLPYIDMPKVVMDNNLGEGGECLYNDMQEKCMQEKCMQEESVNMALPNLDDFAEEARKFYKSEIAGFLDMKKSKAYFAGEENRRQLRAIELFRERQYKEHRLEIIEKRLLNEDNPDYNVWEDYPIDWAEIRKIMGGSIEEAIMACNCVDESEPSDDLNNNNAGGANTGGSSVSGADTSGADTSECESIKESGVNAGDANGHCASSSEKQQDSQKIEVACAGGACVGRACATSIDGIEEKKSNFDFDAYRKKVILAGITASKQEEMKAFARAHMLNNDPNFDINKYLKDMLERAEKAEETATFEKPISKNSSAKKTIKKNAKQNCTPMLL